MEPVITTEPIIVAIDHGYGNIKTPTFIFPACVTPCEQGMPLTTDDVLSYEGKRYAIGAWHKEFRQEKIVDEDYYILTLAAIGRELHNRHLSQAEIVIAAGLPLTWAARQREQFQAYLSQNAHVEFRYLDTDFQVEIREVVVYHQGLAAVAHRLRQFRGTNKLVDIGNGTMNVLNINERRPVPESCFTEKFGTYQCSFPPGRCSSASSARYPRTSRSKSTCARSGQTSAKSTSKSSRMQRSGTSPGSSTACGNMNTIRS